tara:strand:- start:173 stop:379 length:207 start_codon:yes stop_codon:yes gene_type:complete
VLALHTELVILLSSPRLMVESSVVVLLVILILFSFSRHRNRSWDLIPSPSSFSRLMLVNQYLNKLPAM